MPRKYLAFDLDTASESMRNLSSRRGLGITCAAVLAEESTDPVVWYAGEDSESPTDQMDADEAQRVVEHLQEYVDAGYTPLTWNGHAFDFRVMAEESGMKDACWDLSLNPIDMMFHVVCTKGFRVSLAAASQAGVLQVSWTVQLLKSARSIVPRTRRVRSSRRRSGGIHGAQFFDHMA